MTITKSKRLLKSPFWMGFFIVCGIIILARVFIIHPYRIPSASMLPTLHIGDFILVNRASYGIRLPFSDFKIIKTASPQRGEVMVFRFPRNPKSTFIKRVVGLPGDILSYTNKQLFVNSEAVQVMEDREYIATDGKLAGRPLKMLTETIVDSSYSIILDDQVASKDMEVIVPEGHYFVLGDNRDHSNDSRYWRFVPEENLIGKAFYVWFSWKGTENGGVDWGRIGRNID